MIRSPQFLLLFVVLVVGQGSGLLFINNAPQMSDAYIGSHKSGAGTTLVSLVSCFNSFGRLIYGNVSEAMLPRVSRIWFLFFSLSLLSLSYWLLLLFGEPMLTVVGAIVGFAYGGLWGVQPVILVEVFGPADYGMKYACSAIAAFAGSVIFPTLIAGTLYDEETRRLHTDGSCFQPSCFSTTNLITGCLGIVGCLLTLIVHAMTRNVYAAHRERLRLLAEA
jgi:MFS family permease